MLFVIKREELLKPLQEMISIADKKHSMLILSHILVKALNNKIILKASDLEIEIKASISNVNILQDGTTTIPARKFFDIVKSLPQDTEIKFELLNDKVKINSGKANFILSTLDFNEFTSLDKDLDIKNFTVNSKNLYSSIKKTSSSISNKDNNVSLNGMLWNFEDNNLFTVATNGHRLAYSNLKIDTENNMKIIVPRKAILELNKILHSSDENISVYIGKNHIKIDLEDITFISKLIDGNFPNYKKVLPKLHNNKMIINTSYLINALKIVEICSNTRNAVNWDLQEDSLKLSAKNNIDNEKAENEIEVNYKNEDINSCYNIKYLLDALQNIDTDEAELCFLNSKSSLLIKEPKKDNNLFLIMSIRI